jgi:hypothetical protein
MLIHVPSVHEAARSTQGTVSNRTPVPTDFSCSVQPVIIRRVLPGYYKQRTVSDSVQRKVNNSTQHIQYSQ